MAWIGEFSFVLNVARQVEAKLLCMANTFLVLYFSSPEEDCEEKQKKQAEEKKHIKSLFKTIKNDDFPIVQGKLTAKSIMSCGRNPLLVAIKVRTNLLKLSPF